MGKVRNLRCYTVLIGSDLRFRGAYCLHLCSQLPKEQRSFQLLGSEDTLQSFVTNTGNYASVNMVTS